MSDAAPLDGNVADPQATYQTDRFAWEQSEVRASIADGTLEARHALLSAQYDALLEHARDTEKRLHEMWQSYRWTGKT